MNPRKTITYALVVAASFLILAGISSSRAYAQSNGAATLQNQPFTFEVSPACNGDDVVVTGKLSLTEHEFTASDGSLHLNLNLTAHGTATGSPSGENYVFNASESETGNVSTNNTGEETVVPLSFELISKGGGQNLYVTEHIHVTVNANGTTTVYFDNISITCHG